MSTIRTKKERFGCSSLAGFIHRGVETGSVERSSRPVKVPCGRIWPNGEFGLGYSYDKQETDPFSPVEAGGVSTERLREECATALDLTSPPNSHISPNRPDSYGRKGLSGYGGKFVRNAGYVLQDRYGKKRLTFLTLTLPAMSGSDAIEVARTWGETVRQLFQWLSRQLATEGLPTAICGVTELQTQRLEHGDLACLHLHVVFVGRRANGPWAITPKKVRSWWLGRLSRVTSGSVESMNCVDMKSVRRDAGNYLSKYMSKGVQQIEAFAERVGWSSVPRQWWNVTGAMRAAVKSACLSSGSIMKVLDAMVYNSFVGCDDVSFRFIRVIELQATEYQSFVVGYWGRLRDDAVRELGEMSRSLG